MLSIYDTAISPQLIISKLHVANHGLLYGLMVTTPRLITPGYKSKYDL